MADKKEEIKEVKSIKKYEVIEYVFDEEDPKKTVYKVGDSFPKPANKKISEERLNELLTSKNKLGKPVIKEIK